MATKKTALKKKPCLKKKQKVKKQKQEKIGKITHYFRKPKVAVVKLKKTLKEGDKIRVLGGEQDFKQTVKSMEIDHKKIKRALKGKTIGLKLSKKVREGYFIFKA